MQAAYIEASLAGIVLMALFARSNRRQGWRKPSRAEVLPTASDNLSQEIRFEVASAGRSMPRMTDQPDRLKCY